MKRLSTLAALFVSAISFAGQAGAIDPPRPVAASTGFYVVGSKLYDPAGNEFRIRGTNWGHLDQAGGLTGIPLSGANAVRMVTNYTPAATTQRAVSTMLAAGVVPIPSVWTTTCKSDPASLSAAVDKWIAEFATWKVLNTSGLLNIANEWGPPNSPVWRDENIKAIARLRAAGYTSTLVVDSGGCGQDPLDVVNHGAAVLASDPLKNVLFDIHVYGVYVLNPNASWKTDYVKSMAALKATGLPIFIGEFGPGNNVGSSPTTIPPQTVIDTAEANGWGWMPWSWDDNNQTACQSSDGYFALSRNCGKYAGADATELSALGRLIVPLFKANARKATLK
jgi:mannan endo-1,4-beta-mannosidase